MPFTTNKNIEQPAFNSYIDDWDTPVNANWALIDKAMGNSVTINTTGLSGTIALSTSQYQNLTIRFTGTPAGAITYSVPSPVGGQWVVRNDTLISVNFISAAAAGVIVTVPAAANLIATCDGSATGMRQAVSVPSAAAGSNQQIQYNAGGSLAGSSALFFDGTFLWTTGLVVGGNTVLGNNGGNFITINASAIDLPNNAVFGSGTLLALQQSTGQVGIGLAPSVGDKLTVGGRVRSTAGGFMFPDGTTQTTAAAGVSPGGINTSVQFNNAGALGGAATFTYNSGTQILTNTHLIITGNAGFNTAGFSGAVNMASTLSVTGVIGTSGGISTTSVTATGNIITSAGMQANALSLTGTPLGVASGGTNATTAAAALTSLGALGKAGGGVSTANYMTGDLLSGQNTTLTPGAGNNTVGSNFSANGSLHLSHNGLYCLSINRAAGDGDIVIFQRVAVNTGSISVSGATTAYNTTSDRREKSITGDAVGLLDKLDLVNVYRGYFKRDEDRRERYLVMADEIQKVVPDIVTGEPNGPENQLVNWSGAVPWLIGLIKELKDEVEILKAKLA